MRKLLLGAPALVLFSTSALCQSPNLGELTKVWMRGKDHYDIATNAYAPEYAKSPDIEGALNAEQERIRMKLEQGDIAMRNEREPRFTGARKSSQLPTIPTQAPDMP